MVENAYKVTLAGAFRARSPPASSGGERRRRALAATFGGLCRGS